MHKTQNVCWKGLYTPSVENARVTLNGQQIEVVSAVEGEKDGSFFRVAYRIQTNEKGGTVLLRISIAYGEKTTDLLFESDGKGSWKKNGHTVNELTGCTDVDISVTPFTNTLPVNRLRMPIDASHIIRVLYVDVFENKIGPVKQKYTRLTKNQYLFENIPNDFEARITTDENGLVLDYPGLFKRAT